jgi:hypothetical protein
LILLVHVLNEYAGLSIYLQCLDFCVTNIVTACRLGRDIDMTRLTEDYSFNGGTWRADVFPGYKIQSTRRSDGTWTDDPDTIYKPDKTRGEFTVSYIVFSNGNCNVSNKTHTVHYHIPSCADSLSFVMQATGLRREEDVPDVEQNLHRLLQPYLVV